MGLAQHLLTGRNRLAYNILCFLDLFRRAPPTRFATLRCSTFPRPDTVRTGAIYVTQLGRLRKWASFRCPGDCGKIVRLRLASTESPHWSLATDWLGRATIAPSILQRNSCRCHFSIRRACVHWYADTPQLRRHPTHPTHVTHDFPNPAEDMPP